MNSEVFSRNDMILNTKCKCNDKKITKFNKLNVDCLKGRVT